MWRLVVSELAGKSVYKNQKLLFMSTIKANVKAIYYQGKKIQSAFFGKDTKPIFRSESARYVLFIQMSKEMWDFDTDGTGEIMFHKVINGFLPELFRRWQDLGARHLLSIILFTRMEYERTLTSTFELPKEDPQDPGITHDGEKKPYKDFYRVLVSDMASGEWSAILTQLKKEFKVFLRDVSIRNTCPLQNLSLNQEGFFSRGEGPRDIIAGHPTAAKHSNILEAINVASSQFSGDYIDRDLVRTGLSIIVVTPGSGVFEVDHNLLNLTTDVLVENGVGIGRLQLPLISFEVLTGLLIQTSYAYLECLYILCLCSSTRDQRWTWLMTVPRESQRYWGLMRNIQAVSEVMGALAPFRPLTRPMI